MIQYEEDTPDQDIQISNVADWMKFNSPSINNNQDPFSIEGEDVLKLSGLSPAMRRKVSRDIQKNSQAQRGQGHSSF